MAPSPTGGVDASPDLPDAAAPSDATAPDDAATPDDAGDAGSGCSTSGPLAMAGDYVAPDGTQHWLRQSLTATTYTVVPAGAPDPSAPPRLSRIPRVCPQWLLLAGTDGTTARLDWAPAAGSGISICVRTAADAGAAEALPAANPGDLETGCGGAAWTALTMVMP